MEYVRCAGVDEYLAAPASVRAEPVRPPAGLAGGWGGTNSAAPIGHDRGSPERIAEFQKEANSDTDPNVKALASRSSRIRLAQSRDYPTVVGWAGSSYSTFHFSRPADHFGCMVTSSRSCVVVTG